MASIFCPECGAKAAYTLNKPKFCQTCGEKFEIGSIVASEVHKEEGLEDIPEITKLDYSIEMEDGKTTLGDLFQSPLDPASLTKETPLKKGRPKKHLSETKESFLARSMAECASSRQQPAITEDGES